MSKDDQVARQLTLKKKTSQIDLYLVSLSSKTYVFEDKMT